MYKCINYKNRWLEVTDKLGAIETSFAWESHINKGQRKWLKLYISGNNRYKQPHNNLSSYYTFCVLLCISAESSYWDTIILDYFHLLGKLKAHIKSCLFTFEYISYHSTFHYLELRMDFKVFWQGMETQYWQGIQA